MDASQFSGDRQQVTKGVMGAGAGFTAGTRDQRSGQEKHSETVVGSTVGSVSGDVSIVAGRDFSQVGSIVQTPKGDVEVLAQRISITAAAQQGKDVQTTAFRQSGLSLSVSAPVLSALESTMQMAENIDKVGDARMQALGAASTAIKAKEAAQALQADPKAAGGLSISITVGGSQSKSRTETTTTTHQGSEITAGGDVRLVAQGAGKNSSISVQGSDVSAAERLALKAEGDISLTSVQDLVKQKSSNSSSSAAVGVAIGVGSGGASIGFTASASMARGKSDGEDVIQRNTHLQGQQVSFESGGDTTLKGAVISGDRVQGKVGGNLNIESQQDTSRFKSESMQAGGSMTVGMGFSGSASFGQSKVNSDFASVTEQSGIRARSAGFQLEVKGNTDLKGGSITSAQAAVDSAANTFKTGSLTLSDIENKADYKGSSYSVSAGFGKKEEGAPKEGQAPKPTDGSYQLTVVKPGGAQGNSAGFGYSSDSASSVTQAGISGIAGNQSVRTGDAESGIQRIFDKDKVQQDLAAQVAITQTFGKEASKQIGDLADQRLVEAIALRAQANAISDPVKQAQLVEQAESLESRWGPNGSFRIAAHAIVGGLTGNAGGAAGAAMGASVGPEIKAALERAGFDDNFVNIVTTIASTGAGGLLGRSPAGAVSAFNEITNNYLSHQQVNKMLDELRDAKSQEQRNWILESYAKLSQIQKSTIASCRDSTCEEIKKDIAGGQAALDLNAKEIGRLAGWFSDEKLTITNLQIDDKYQLRTQIDFNEGAKERIKTFQNMNVSAPLLKAIEFGMACTTAACVQDQYIQLRALQTSASLDDQKAIALEIGYLQGRIQTFGACLKNTMCDGIATVASVLSAIRVSQDTRPEEYPRRQNNVLDSHGKASSGTCSFRGDMEVQTAWGFRAIRDVAAGDLVLAKDEITGEVTFKRVLSHYSNPYNETVYVKVIGAGGDSQTIVSNRIHPFFVNVPDGIDAPASSEGHTYKGDIKGGRWIDAGNLRPGFALLDALGRFQTVSSVLIRTEKLNAFNLTVEDFHTYFIKAPDGLSAVWVHNNCYDAIPSGASETGKTTPDGRKLYTFQDENGKQITVYKGSDGRYYDPKVYSPTDSLPSGVKSVPAVEQSPIPDIDTFEKRVNGKGLTPEEKLAYKKQVLGDVAEAQGWVIDRDLTKRNGRVVYRDPDNSSILWSQDTGHGRFEKHDRFGNHLGEFNIELVGTKAPQGHKLKVK